jgi:small nuclear ribonucleoprotein (snRNP)-like protein
MRQDTRDMRRDSRQDMRQERDVRPMQDDKPTQNIKEIVKGFVGRNITVAIRGKKTLSGKLESVSNYEILLTVKERPVLIMKHAIDYIELDETPS